MKIEYYESQLKKVNLPDEIKSIIDEAYQDADLLENEIMMLKDYAQELYDEFRLEKNQGKQDEDYLTDDELGLTQM